MTVHFDPPKISGDPKEQVGQLGRYLYALSEKLNWAMGNLPSGTSPALPDAKSLYAQLTPLLAESNDIIKKKGTVGIWTYEITASGLVRCYGKYAYTGLSARFPEESIPGVNIAFPVTFKTVMTVNATSANQENWAHSLGTVDFDNEKISKLTFCFSTVSSTQANAGGTLYFFVVGRI